MCASLESIGFESDSRLERIEKSALAASGLKSIVIPSSVMVLVNECLCKCKSLESVLFEPGSRLERIEDNTFRESGLRSIVIPSSIVVCGLLELR
jgi:hypothetical protein